MRGLAILAGVNVALGAALYVDVCRRGRHPLWLFSFVVVSYPALVAYVLTRPGRVGSAGE